MTAPRRTSSIRACERAPNLGTPETRSARVRSAVGSCRPLAIREHWPPQERGLCVDQLGSSFPSFRTLDVRGLRCSISEIRGKRFEPRGRITCEPERGVAPVAKQPTDDPGRMAMVDVVARRTAARRASADRADPSLVFEHPVVVGERDPVEPLQVLGYLGGTKSSIGSSRAHLGHVLEVTRARVLRVGSGRRNRERRRRAAPVARRSSERPGLAHRREPHRRSKCFRDRSTRAKRQG